MGSDGDNLLIFSERGYQSPTANTPEPQPKAQAKQASQSNATQQPNAPSAKGQFCINHPWRNAFAICDKCRLPYCFVDLMELNHKYYCLTDIDYAVRAEENEKVQAGPNGFAIVASALIIVNSFVLLYFTYPQVSFIIANATGHSGVLAFLLNVSQYYVQFANTMIIFFGVIASLLLMSRSNYSFLVSFVFEFAALFVMVYEYLNSSVIYLLLSSALLLVAISLTTYSRMSSIGQSVERYNVEVPNIDWPKPEAF